MPASSTKRADPIIVVDDESDPNYDSDPDFINGAQVLPEKKPRRKSGKRRADSLESDRSEKPTKKRKRLTQANRGSKPRPNPLLAYFGNLDLHSDSSEEEVDVETGLDFYYTSDAEEKVADGPVPVNKFARYARRAPAAPAGSETEDDSSDEEQAKSARPAARTVAPTGSETEDSTDEEQAKSARPTAHTVAPTGSETEEDSTDGEKIKNARPVARAVGTTGSETEDSSDDENPPPPRKQLKTGSETESDSEPACNVRKLAPPYKQLASTCQLIGSKVDPTSRPGFPIPPGQEAVGPLVLDAAQGIQVPKAINVYLREYQREGVQFFWERYSEGRGGLLGDDMGLGKTIQVISFLSAIMKKNGVASDRGRRREHVSRLQDSREWKKERKLPPADATWPTCLIIAPLSVVGNWEREFELWGYFEVGRYTGDPKVRRTVLEDFKKGRLDVVITSIDTARRDIELLDNLPWSCVFVDEVHSVKNPKSQTSRAFNEFECLRRFGLTGTAIQNSYDELWTILDWTSPGMLGEPDQWRGFVSNPLKRGQSASATDQETLLGKKVSQILVKEFLPRFFKRRTKAIIAHQLPNKTDEVVFCPLTEKQIEVYKKILRMPDLQAVLNRNELCDCGSGERQMKCCLRYDPATVFKYLHVLIKLSNHLGLILPSPNDSHEQLVRNRELAARAFSGKAPAFDVAILDSRYCGKWNVLLSLLKDWRKDKTNKVLIFTKSVKLLDMMEFQLKTMDKPYGFLRFDGHVAQEKRLPLIDQFHSDPNIFIFLISTAAGGTGLNLTGANKVVIFDPNWNPAQDLQAMDRAFRFGQTRDVSVVRLLGAGSIEELVYARQLYKQQQMRIGYDASIQTRYFEGVQGDKARQGELFGLNNMFKLHEHGLATKMTIEKAHMAELDWALTTMDAPQGKCKKKGGDFELGDTETKLDKEYSDLKGLGALLFDDALPSTSKNSLPAGVARNMYTHQNPDLLKDSKIEEKRRQEIAQKRRRKRKKSLPPTEEAGSETAPWPPVRTRKAAPPRTGPITAEKLRDRMNALVTLGFIKDPSGFGQFAQDFTRRWSAEEQAVLLAELDKYQRTCEDSDSSDDRDRGGGEEMEVEAEDIDGA